MAVNTYLNLVLDEIESHNKAFPCEIEKLGTEEYNFNIDNDPEHGFVYLCGNYDNDTSYDTPFFLKPEDAYYLGQYICNSAMNAMINMQRMDRQKQLENDIKEIISKEQILTFDIQPEGMWTADPKDQFFGKFILHIKLVYKKDDVEHEITAHVMSENLKDHPTYFKLLKDKLNDTYHLSEQVHIEYEKFDSMYIYMMKKWDKFIESTDLEKMDLSNINSPLKREMVDVEKLSKELAQKIKAEQERMKKEEENN